MLQKTNLSLTSHRIVADVTSKQHIRKWLSYLSSSEGRKFRNRFQFGRVFQDNRSRVCGTRASFRGRREHKWQRKDTVVMRAVVWTLLVSRLILLHVPSRIYQMETDSFLSPGTGYCTYKNEVPYAEKSEPWKVLLGKVLLGKSSWEKFSWEKSSFLAGSKSEHEFASSPAARIPFVVVVVVFYLSCSLNFTRILSQRRVPFQMNGRSDCYL